MLMGREKVEERLVEEEKDVTWAKLGLRGILGLRSPLQDGISA